jgi:hypothetical protein
MTPNPIILLGSGQRTGSTLLQRFMVSNPNIMIWGEHDGVFSDIYRKYDRLYEWDAMFSHQLETFQTDGFNNFIPNMIPSSDVIRASQRAMLEVLYRDTALNLGRNIWGFKEVLYDAEMAARLRDLFPGMKVVYITRHPFGGFTSLLHEERLKPTEVNIPLKDIWTREKTTQWIDTWVDINESFLDHPAINDEWVFSMTYEELIGDTAAVTGSMIDWLDLPRHDFDLDVFNVRLYTDRDNGQAVRRDERPRIDWADLTAEEYRLMTQPRLIEVATRLGYEIPEPRKERV